ARRWQPSPSPGQSRRPAGKTPRHATLRYADLGYAAGRRSRTLVGILADRAGLMPPAIPTATYRLQFSKDFGFRQAAALVPYLRDLGISHVYASPFLQAREGSTHGYDVVDHNRIDPQFGGEAEFDRFCGALAEAGLGLILDFVPNHMGIGRTDNAWWLDMLE